MFQESVLVHMGMSADMSGSFLSMGSSVWWTIPMGKTLLSAPEGDGEKQDTLPVEMGLSLPQLQLN